MRKIFQATPTVFRRRENRERGGAFTFIVLSASMVLLAMGGAFMTPARHTLSMNGVQFHKLVARTLAESGVDWALSQNLTVAQKQELKHSSGTVKVTITPQNGGLTLISCQSKPSKTRQRTKFQYKLTAIIQLKNGKRLLSNLETSFTEEK